jgi:hypothetical protein
LGGPGIFTSGPEKTRNGKRIKRSKRREQTFIYVYGSLGTLGRLKTGTSHFKPTKVGKCALEFM